MIQRKQLQIVMPVYCDECTRLLLYVRHILVGKQVSVTLVDYATDQNAFLVKNCAFLKNSFQKTNFLLSITFQ